MRIRKARASRDHIPCVHLTEGGELSGGPRTSFVEGMAASAEAPLSPNWRWIQPAHPGYQHLRASARKSVSVCTQDRTDALQIVTKRNISALTFRAVATSNSTTTPARLGPAAVTLLCGIVAPLSPPAASLCGAWSLSRLRQANDWRHIRFNQDRRKREGALRRKREKWELLCPPSSLQCELCP